jgi:hypothetical protein
LAIFSYHVLEKVDPRKGPQKKCISGVLVTLIINFFMLHNERRLLMENLITLDWLIAGALYEALRFRKEYAKTDRLARFTAFGRCYGVQFLKERYANGEPYYQVRLYRTTDTGENRTWIADLNSNSLGLDEMTKIVRSTILRYK